MSVFLKANQRANELVVKKKCTCNFLSLNKASVVALTHNKRKIMWAKNTETLLHLISSSAILLSCSSRDEGTKKWREVFYSALYLRFGGRESRWHIFDKLLIC